MGDIKHNISSLRALGICFLIGVILGAGGGYLGAKYLGNSARACDVGTEVGGGTLSKGQANLEKDDAKEKQCNLFVDVSGAVMSPGVYCFEEGDIVNDAIHKAGDFSRDSYASKYISQKFNLARELKPAEKLYVPFEYDTTCQSEVIDEIGDPGVSEEDLVDIVCVSLNNASVDELVELPGVGEATATRIVDGRPYKKIDDLKNVSGIGDATFDKMKDLICL